MPVPLELYLQGQGAKTVDFATPQDATQQLQSIVQGYQGMTQNKQKIQENQMALGEDAMRLYQEHQETSDNDIMTQASSQLKAQGAKTTDADYGQKLIDLAQAQGLSQNGYFRWKKNYNDLDNARINQQIGENTLAENFMKMPKDVQTVQTDMTRTMYGELSGVAQGIKDKSLDPAAGVTAVQNSIDEARSQVQGILKAAQTSGNKPLAQWAQNALKAEEQLKKQLIGPNGQINPQALDSIIKRQQVILNAAGQGPASDWQIITTQTMDPTTGLPTTHAYRVNKVTGATQAVGELAGAKSGGAAGGAGTSLPQGFTQSDVMTVAGALKNAGISVPGGMSGKAVISNTLPYINDMPRNPGESIEDYAQRVADKALAGKSQYTAHTTEARVTANQIAKVRYAAEALMKPDGYIDQLTAAVNKVGYSNLKKLGNWQKWTKEQLSDADLANLKYWLQETRADLQQVFSRGGQNTEGGNERAAETLPDIITPDVMKSLGPAIKQGIEIQENALNDSMGRITGGGNGAESGGSSTGGNNKVVDFGDLK